MARNVEGAGPNRRPGDGAVGAFFEVHRPSRGWKMG